MRPPFCLCLQHVEFEGPGRFARWFSRRGIPFQTRLVPRDGLPDELPESLLVLGGPMSANDTAPWIHREMQFIRAMAEAGRPVLGICLGSQLLARAFGGQVCPGPFFEAGICDIELTRQGHRDPLLSVLPRRTRVFQWHGEIILPPLGASSLAASEGVPTQAFRIAPNAWGLLFHLEIERPGLEALCHACPEEIARANTSSEKIQSDWTRRAPELHHRADALLEAWQSVPPATPVLP